MIKQNKGKDLDNIALSRLPSGPFFVSKKYDGHYVQIHKIGNEVKMYTSGGKRFFLRYMADYIVATFDFDFKIECEFNYSCEGFLGDRGKSAILTTYRTNYSKGRPNTGDSGRDIFRVLDVLDKPHVQFKQRLVWIAEHFSGHPWFFVPVQLKCMTLAGAVELSTKWKEEGYEGAMAKATDHLYESGKRSNDIVKLKPRLTADLLIVDWKNGDADGKYYDCIGAYLLRDSRGREVWAGSGLSDDHRHADPELQMGKVVEIEYERIDNTYIQPIIKHFRWDKTKEDIN